MRIALNGVFISYMLQLMGCLHDPANVQQTSSKCIQNTRANCWTYAGSLLDVCCYLTTFDFKQSMAMIWPGTLFTTECIND